eukprot:7197267-Pyramimonas_sp.AAC.2
MPSAKSFSRHVFVTLCQPPPLLGVGNQRLGVNVRAIYPSNVWRICATQASWPVCRQERRHDLRDSNLAWNQDDRVEATE